MQTRESTIKKFCAIGLIVSLLILSSVPHTIGVEPKEGSMDLGLKSNGSHNSGLVYVVVADNIYNNVGVNVRSAVEQYKVDVEGDPSSDFVVEIVVWDELVNGFEPARNLRSFLLDAYNVSGLVGALFVGDIPYVEYYYHIEGPDEFVCDLFFNDLDGNWVDSNGDGLLDDRVGGGLSPEIWSGRIRASSISDGDIGLEIDFINNYFRKNHAFRSGSVDPINKIDDRALVWSTTGFGAAAWESLYYLYDDISFFEEPVTTKDNFSDNMSVDGSGFEWVRIGGHSGTGMADGVYNFDRIMLDDPMGLVYDLDGCSPARFDGKSPGQGFIFAPSFGLACVGATSSTWSTITKDVFFALLRQGYCLGEAVLENSLMRSVFPESFSYVVLGDPLLFFTNESWLGEHIIPDAPLPPGGGPEGDVGGPDIVYNFSFDPVEENGLKFFIDWDDGKVDWSNPVFGGIPPYAYEWNFGDCSPIAIEEFPNHAYEAVGDYTIGVNVTDSTDEGCSEFSQLRVIDFFLYPSYIDLWHFIRFSYSTEGGTPPFTQVWDFGDGNFSDLAQPDHHYAEPGIYTVELNVTDATGASVSESFIFFSGDDLFVDAGGPYECFVGESSEFFSFAFGGDPSSYSFSWDFNGDGIHDSAGNSAEWVYDYPGLYELILTVSDNTGINVNDTAIVKVNWVFINAPNKCMVGENIQFSGRIKLRTPFDISHSYLNESINKVRVRKINRDGALSDWSQPRVITIGSPTMVVDQTTFQIAVEEGKSDIIESLIVENTGSGFLELSVSETSFELPFVWPYCDNFFFASNPSICFDDNNVLHVIWSYFEYSINGWLSHASSESWSDMNNQHIGSSFAAYVSSAIHNDIIHIITNEEAYSQYWWFNMSNETWTQQYIFGHSHSIRSLAVDSQGNAHAVGKDPLTLLTYYDLQTSEETQLYPQYLTGNNPPPLNKVDGDDNLHVIFLNEDLQLYHTWFDRLFGQWIPPSALVTNLDNERIIEFTAEVDMQGDVYVLWASYQDEDDTTADVFVKRWNRSTQLWSSDDGLTPLFTTSYPYSDKNDAYRYIKFEIDSNDQMHILWRDKHPYTDDIMWYHQNWNTMFQPSSEKQIITFIKSEETMNNYYDLAVNSQGQIHIVSQQNSIGEGELSYYYNNPNSMEFIQMLNDNLIVTAGETSEILCFVDATQLSQGTYTTYLDVLSNDEQISMLRLPIDITVFSPVPAAPEKLFTVYTDTSIELYWTPVTNSEDGYPVDDIAGHVIERKVVDNGDWTEIGQTTHDITYFDDTTVEQGVNYIYRIKTNDKDDYESNYTYAQKPICGDADADGEVTVGDTVYLINSVFKGGPAAFPLCAGDTNGDGSANVGDVIYLINYIFNGGPAPVNDCCG